jgi:hypothetical protein
VVLKRVMVCVPGRCGFCGQSDGWSKTTSWWKQEVTGTVNLGPADQTEGRKCGRNKKEASQLVRPCVDDPVGVGPSIAKPSTRNVLKLGEES